MDVNLSFPAIQGCQARENFYIGMVKTRICVRIFEFVDELVPAELRMQRLIDLNRVRAISIYLESRRDDYILPPIIAQVNGSMKFQPFSEEYSEMGMLFISTDSPIFICDGQHRVKGLAKAIDADESLGTETVPVAFYQFKGVKEAQKKFADINRSAKPTPQSLNFLYDHSDNIAEVSRRLLTKVPLIDRLCEKDKNSTSGKSPYLFPFKDFYKANKIIYRAFMKQKKEPPELDELVELIGQFWEIVVENMGEWQSVDKSQQTAERCRYYNISSHGIALEALGEIGKQLLLAGTEAVELEQKLNPLKDFNWNKNNSSLQEACMERGKVVKNRTTTTTLVQMLKTHLKLT